MQIKLKEIWMNQLRLLVISLCLTTVIIFLSVSNMDFDIAYLSSCIIGIVNFIHIGATYGDALAVAKNNDSASAAIDIRWGIALVVCAAYYIFFPALVKNWMVA